jgi:hypothetical protein
MHPQRQSVIKFQACYHCFQRSLDQFLGELLEQAMLANRSFKFLVSASRLSISSLLTVISTPWKVTTAP